MLCCYSQYSILLLPSYGIVRRAPYAVRQAADIVNSLKGNLVTHLIGRSRAGGLDVFRPFVLLCGQRNALLQCSYRCPECVYFALVVIFLCRTIPCFLCQFLSLLIGQSALDVVLIDVCQKRFQVIVLERNDLFKEFFQKITPLRRAPMRRLNCSKEPPVSIHRSADTRPCIAAMCRRPDTRPLHRYRSQ